MAALGLDVELDTPLSERVAERICSASERERLAALATGGAQWEKLVFSAKESFYKAYFSLTRTYLGFQDVEIAFDATARSFELAELPPLTGFLRKPYPRELLFKMIAQMLPAPRGPSP